MKRATLNYWLDVAIALAFVLSAASGMVFLLPMGSGNTILGVGTRAWSDLHTWSSLFMVGGVVAHLALHWKWIVQVSRKQLLGAGTARTLRPVPEPIPSGRPVAGLTRRSFLTRSAALGLGAGVGAAMLGVASRWGVEATPAAGPDTSRANWTDRQAAGGADQAAGHQTAEPPAVSATADATRAEQADAAGDPAARQGVACRHGLVNDPYPGQCRQYLDRDSDGVCDYSVPGSGSNVRFDG